MARSPESVELATKWIERAGRDLLTAQHTLKLGDNCPFDTVCFHAQQCVEKCLKALLIFNSVHFPRTHDLTELKRQFPSGTWIDGIAEDDLAELGPYAVEARYPGDWEGLGRDEADRAVAIAVRVFDRTRLAAKVL